MTASSTVSTDASPRSAVPTRPTPPGWLVWAALGVVYVVWGSTYLAIRVSVRTLPPFASSGARFLLAGVIVYAAVVAVRGLDAVKVTRTQLGNCAVVGVLLLAGGNGVVVLAERTVPSGLAALIIAAVPLWLVLLRMLGRDRPTRLTVAGVLLGLSGVSLLLLPGSRPEGATAGGVLLVVFASLSWALGSYYASRRELPRNPFTVTALEMLCGGAALSVLATVRGEVTGFSLEEVSGESAAAFAYLIVFGSLLAFTAYAWLLLVAPVSKVATYAYVNPVVAVLLGALLLDEPVSPAILGGGAVTVAAVAVVVTAETRRQRQARSAAPEAASCT